MNEEQQEKLSQVTDKYLDWIDHIIESKNTEQLVDAGKILATYHELVLHQREEEQRSNFEQRLIKDLKNGLKE